MTAARTTTIDIRLALALAALVGCGGDKLLLPGDGEPTRITAVEGDNQTGTVGQPLGDSLVVEVTDPAGRLVPGVEVVFLPPPGAVVAPNDTVTTGANGRASVRYTLSTTAGEQMIQARATRIVPASSSTATFRAAAQPEGAVALVVAGGNGQTAQVETVLAESLAVRAVDRFDNGVAGIEVIWEATGGSVSPTSDTTGSDGRAATERTLGDRPGTYPAAAAAGELEGSPVSFTATAIAAPRPELVVVTEPSSSAAAGVVFDRQPELQLQDALGAPLNRADVSVTVQVASGSGSLGGRTTARSDANGRVRFNDLAIRGETGVRTLIFAADGFTPAISAAIAVSPGPPSTSRSSASVPNGTAGAETRISLHLEDEFGNAVTSASGALSINVEGANPASSLPVTHLGDGDYSASYVPVHSGSDAVHIQVNGSALAGSPFQSTVSPGPADPSTTTALVTRSGVFIYRIDVLVTTRDAQGNLLGRGGDDVQVQPEGGAPQPATDNGDGTYSASIFTFVFDLRIAVTLNGVPIAGSPFGP
jgi:hypothetical protein